PPCPFPASALSAKESAPPAVIARGNARSSVTPARRARTGHRPRLLITGDGQPASGSTISAEHGAGPPRPPAKSRLARAVTCPGAGAAPPPRPAPPPANGTVLPNSGEQRQ